MLRREKTTRRASGYPASPLKPGTPAPVFELLDHSGEPVSLSKYLDRPVILVFYPADWSAVCGDQLSLYNEVLPLFEEHRAQLLAISVDGRWCHHAFVENRNLRFPLLSDFEPKGEIAKRYGVYDSDQGVALRALFVVDPQGIIRWSHLSPSGVNPGADGILHALETL